jgi:hypothetical protein
LCKLDAELLGKSFGFSDAIVDPVDVCLFRNDQGLSSCNCEQKHDDTDNARNQTDSTAFWRGAIDESKA